jgi:hypothetical protein
LGVFIPKHFLGQLLTVHYPVELVLGDGCEIISFRAVLANEGIGALISSSFPGGIGMSEVEAHLEPIRNGPQLSDCSGLLKPDTELRQYLRGLG